MLVVIAMSTGALVASGRGHSEPWPPWTPIGHGYVYPVRVDTYAGFVAGSVRATAPFLSWLRENDADAVRAVDYRRDAVVFVSSPAHDSGMRVRLASLRRVQSVLLAEISITSAPPGTAVTFEQATAYQIVTLPRRLIGTPLPRRVLVRPVSG